MTWQAAARRRAAGGVGLASAVAALALPSSLAAVPQAAVHHQSGVTAASDGKGVAVVRSPLVLQGHGYGHGHGMSQYGAQGAALQGLGYRSIVDFYYPGTRLREYSGHIRVLLSAAVSSNLQVRPAKGLRVRNMATGVAWRLPAGQGVDRWRLTGVDGGGTAVESHDARGWSRWPLPNGRTSLRAAAQFRANGALTLLQRDGASMVATRYRGGLRLVQPAAGSASRDTVNVLGIDAYVSGVVPLEVPSSWEPAALRAQSVAARSYAAWHRAQYRDRYYHICDTTSCQVYGGAAAEQPSTNAAVQATSREVLKHDGKPALTQFSSSSGGWTADGGLPYLRAQRDTFDGFSGNPMHTWTVSIPAATVERGYPALGRFVSLRVVRRDGHGDWNGRVEQLRLVGTKGTVALSGDDMRLRYGLRSSWFRVRP